MDDGVNVAEPHIDDNVEDNAPAIALTEKVYADLTRDILSGDLAPGKKLSEPAIARLYGASRAPVREAIRRLQERGLVSYAVNQGVRVAVPTAEEYIALLDVREAMEGMAVRLAAAQMSDRDLTALLALVKGHRGEIERNEGAYLQDDPETDFHMRIAHGSGNPILANLLCDQFYPRLRLCRRIHRSVPGRGAEAWKEHMHITEALVQRDGELAEILMRRHIRSAKAALKLAFATAQKKNPGRRKRG